MVNLIAIICAKYLFVLPVIILLIYFFLQPRFTQKRLALLSAVSLALTGIGIFILHHLYYNPRPFVVGNFKPLIDHVADNGFPSEHATFTALIASVIFVFNRKLGLFLFFISIIVSIARVYTGLHHIVDIIAGVALAIIATAISEALIQKFVLKQVKK